MSRNKIYYNIRLSKNTHCCTFFYVSLGFFYNLSFIIIWIFSRSQVSSNYISPVSTEVKLGFSLVIVSKKISQTDLGRGLWTAETWWTAYKYPMVFNPLSFYGAVQSRTVQQYLNNLAKLWAGTWSQSPVYTIIKYSFLHYRWWRWLIKITLIFTVSVESWRSIWNMTGQCFSLYSSPQWWPVSGP